MACLKVLQNQSWVYKQYSYIKVNTIYSTKKLFRPDECDEIGKAVKKFWLKKNLLDWKSIKLLSNSIFYFYFFIFIWLKLWFSWWSKFENWIIFAVIISFLPFCFHIFVSHQFHRPRTSRRIWMKGENKRK